MMKLKFLTQSFLFMLGISGSSYVLYAQDSLKKTTPKTIAKPVPAKATSATPYRAPGTVQQGVVKPQVPATVTTPAQTLTGAETPISTDKSLPGQYQYVLSKVYHYQQPMVAALWKNVNDTLNVTRKNLKAVQVQLAEQGKSISGLKNDAKVKEAAINEANTLSDQISLLGLYLPKSTYNLIMWGLVIGLGVVLLVVILKTTGAGREARYRTSLYEELNEEFSAFKVKANDKEKKLARELQTERNKIDELMGRG